MQARNHENSDEIRPTPLRHLDLNTPAFYYYRKNPKCYHTVWGKTTKTAWEKTDRPRDDLLQCFDCSLSLHDPAGNDLENRPHFRHMRNLETIRNVLFSLPWFFENWEHGKTMDFARAMCLCQFFFVEITTFLLHKKSNKNTCFLF